MHASHGGTILAARTDPLEAIGALMPFRRGCEIYGEGEASEYFYKLLSGTVRACKVLEDGRRQVRAFYMPGDVFGLQHESEHIYSAEAVTDCKVLVIKRSAAMALASRDRAVMHRLLAITNRELAHGQEQVLMLVKGAHERVAHFLLEMAKRSPGATTFDMSMTRQDVADYLGLKIETVSRAFTALKLSRVIGLPNARRVEIRNRAALTRLDS